MKYIRVQVDDLDFHERFKAECKRQGLTMSARIVDLMRYDMMWREFDSKIKKARKVS